jgi:ketol-acid reductoisomerase
MELAHCADGDPALIRDTRVAVFGYGAQGRAQAANLRDSGVAVRVALRASSARRAEAEADGHTVLTPDAAAAWADLAVLLIPDAAQPALYAEVLAGGLRQGAALVFAHGYAIHYGHLSPRADLDVILVAPLAIGEQVRREYLAGGGASCLLAVAQDASGQAWPLARAYAWADGHARASMLVSTFADETETDLFAEQTILTGGLQELIDAGFQTLVDAGYPAELAYICCLEEVKLMADLMLERGIAGMRRSISATAEYGGYTRGPRIVGPAARAEMVKVLAEIRSGAFDRELQAALADGGSQLDVLRQRFAARAIEAAARDRRDEGAER